MRNAILAVLFVAGGMYVQRVEAYSIECKKDGTACDVRCDSGQLIGTMYWNGAKWSDGIRADADKHVVAKLMVKAWGTACT